VKRLGTGSGVGGGSRQPGLQAHGRQGRAQFMSRIGDELALVVESLRQSR